MEGVLVSVWQAERPELPPWKVKLREELAEQFHVCERQTLLSVASTADINPMAMRKIEAAHFVCLKGAERENALYRADQCLQMLDELGLLKEGDDK